MSPYANFELLGLHFAIFSFFKKYLLRMCTDKRKEIFFDKLLKHCLDNDKSHQHAKMGVIYSETKPQSPNAMVFDLAVRPLL